MRSVSTKQAKLMAIAAHTPGGYGGVPQGVGEEFHQADAGKKYGAKNPAPESHRKVAAALMGKRGGGYGR